ncbi:hypothetical protein, partial [Mesorhizobium sp. M0244]
MPSTARQTYPTAQALQDRLLAAAPLRRAADAQHHAAPKTRQCETGAPLAKSLLFDPLGMRSSSYRHEDFIAAGNNR